MHCLFETLSTLPHVLDIIDNALVLLARMFRMHCGYRIRTVKQLFSTHTLAGSQHKILLESLFGKLTRYFKFKSLHL